MPDYTLPTTAIARLLLICSNCKYYRFHIIPYRGSKIPKKFPIRRYIPVCNWYGVILNLPNSILNRYWNVLKNPFYNNVIVYKKLKINL